MNSPVNISDLEVGYDVPAKPGMDEADIQTPCLVVDLDALTIFIRFHISFMASMAVPRNVPPESFAAASALTATGGVKVEKTAK